MPKRKDNVKVGLQAKAIIVLAFLVLGTTICGGWTYLHIVCDWIETSNLQQAQQLANAIGLSAAPLLARHDDAQIKELAQTFLQQANTLYVGILDGTGREVAVGCYSERGRQAQSIVPEPVTISYVRHAGQSCLVVCKPIFTPSGGSTPVGAIRLTLDSSQSSCQAQRAYNTMLLVACAIVLLAIPTGYVLVWRVISLPIRRLMDVTGRLAQGDFSARAMGPRNDEIGSLADSFNRMAEEISGQRQLLLAAKDQLEQKVLQRTAELNEANDRLRSEMAEKEEFLRTVSHDLNAPLRNIAGMAAMVMLKWRDKLPEEVVTRLQRIQANVESETDLISELLELSRIKSRPQKREWVDMNEIFRQIAESFEFDLRSKDIDLDIAPNMPALFVERSRLRQVFQNLIDNAIKYMGEKPDKRIRVGYVLREREHCFHVADNGPGIAPEEQQKVFHVFKRLASAAASKIPGKGVGLASVKGIVSNYEGRAWVESELGCGSTFYVTLARRSTEPSTEDRNDDNRTADSHAGDNHSARG